jgi:hypothetical protein
MFYYLACFIRQADLSICVAFMCSVLTVPSIYGASMKVHCNYVCIVSIQCIIDHQALPCLLNLLTQNHKKSIKKEACWTISNITAGNKDQIQVYFQKALDKLFVFSVTTKWMTTKFSRVVVIANRP